MKPPVSALILLILSGCAVGPDFVRPDAPKVLQYTAEKQSSTTAAASGVAQRFETVSRVPIHWWRLFHSEKLDSIVSAAMLDNQSVKAALANLRQSQLNVAAGEGVFYPQFNANLGASRQRQNPVSYGVHVAPSIFNLFTLSGSVGYTLDIFGEYRRELEGLKAQVDLSRYTLTAAYLTLTSNIVNAVIARAAYQAEILATQELIRSQQQQISITEANVKSGITPYENLLSLKEQLAATQATLPPLRLKWEETGHLLAVLAGQMPARWVPPPIRFEDLKLPDHLPQLLPSELVRQRPDILQAEAQLHVASANIGVATAALFPKFTLSATLGVLNTAAGSLFGGRSEFWNYGADITAPLFHGGTLRAQRRVALEAFQAALANYRQAVLTGIQQVADTLRALQHDAELVQAQSDALTSAKEGLKVIQANYQAGTASYLQLLVANSQYFQAEIGYLQSFGQRYQDTVALFVALGGGWWSRPSPAIEKTLKPPEKGS